MIFLTGGTGLVGMRVLYDLVVSGETVRALKRPSSDLDKVREVFDFYHGRDTDELFQKIDWVNGDLLDVVSLQDAMKGCDEVIHAAAMVSFHPREADVLYQMNVLGTRYMVDVALESGIQRFLHISSVAALGRKNDGVAINEQSKWVDGLDASGYARSKYGAEQEVWRGAEEGLSVVIVNPVVVVGAGRAEHSSGQIFAGASGRSRYINGMISLVDVRDVSKMALQLMRSDVRSERFVLCSQDLENQKFMEFMSHAMEVDPPTKQAPTWMLEVAWRVVALKDLIFRTKSLLTKETVKGSLNRYSYDTSKVKDSLDVAFIPVRQSLEYFAPFYR